MALSPQQTKDLRTILEAVGEAAANGDFWNIPDLHYTQAEIDAADIEATAITLFKKLEDSPKALGRVFLERLASIEAAL